MSRTFDLGYKVEDFTYQKEGHTFKGYSRKEGQLNWCRSTMMEGVERKVLSGWHGVYDGWC